MRGKNLLLIGYRGSGKTTIASRLAEYLALDFVDTDQVIEKSAGKTIAQIFHENGEHYFRDLESEAVRGLVTAREPKVVSLGGGAILREENRRHIRALGWTAWLTASPEELAKRIAGDPTTNANRPALSNLGVLSEISKILEYRIPYYSETADATYNTEELRVEHLVSRIAGDYKNWLRTNCSSRLEDSR